MDPVNGGMQGAPEIPPTRRSSSSCCAPQTAAWPGCRDQVLRTLERMSQGGIYDHLGGGFARYSVDERWLVPHFEKMLYDNAQVLELLALAAVETGDPLFAERAGETVGWLRREMTTDGAFCASLDADSEGQEGKFYVWQAEEIARRARRGRMPPSFAAAYDVTAAGNFEDPPRRRHRQRAEPPAPGAGATPRPRRGSPRCGSACWRTAPDGCAPASTTRSWPTGTG